MCWRAKPCMLSMLLLLGSLAMGCASRAFDITSETGSTEGNPTTDDPTFDDTGPTDDPTTEDPTTEDPTTEDPTDDPTDDPTSADITDEDTGDGDGDGDDCVGPVPNGQTCTDNCECESSNCYNMPFLGGWCSECNEDADCSGGGCTQPDPFANLPATCNMGEPEAGCESDVVCMEGLQCGTVLSLLGLIQINTCGHCLSDMDCGAQQICAPIVHLDEWSGINTCINPNSLPQDSYCNLEGNGNDVCGSGICSVVDLMGLAEIGACGMCNSDADCNGGTCVSGVFNFDTAELTGSLCM